MRRPARHTARRMDDLRGRSLAGPLATAEQGERGALMARVEAKEAPALAPTIDHLRSAQAHVAPFVLVVCILLARCAHAADYTAALSVGGVYAGRRLVPAITLQPGFWWRSESGWLVGAQEMLHLLPAGNPSAFGVYNHLTFGVGRAWESVNFTLGIAFPAYFMLACDGTLCSRVAGVGIGAYGQARFFFASPLGLSVSTTVDWLDGTSLALPSNLAVLGVAGPVVRW